jgi:HD-GYP domain-containing protein (c-di-GMP phosphodiesterase class II)
VIPRTEWEVVVNEAITELAAGATTVALYGPAHPRAVEAVRELERHLATLHRGEPELTAVLLGDELFVQGRPFTRTSRQAPAVIRRFRRRGVEHVTFKAGVTAEELRDFLIELASTDDLPVRSRQHVQVGKVELAERDLGGPDDREAGKGRGRLSSVRDRVALVQETLDGYRGGRGLAVAALETVAGSTLAALATQPDPLRLFAPWEGHSRWQAVHAHNVCVLSQALALVAGVGRAMNVELGIAALVHDIGKLELPDELLQREADSASETELELILDHPAAGLAALLRAEQAPPLALVVAFEHHLGYNGSGYPRLAHPRRPHPAARVVSLADAYVVLHSARGARGLTTRESALAWLQQRAGSAFDPWWCAVLRSLVERPAPAPPRP